MRTIPIPQLSDIQNTVLRIAFWSLLEQNEPVPTGRIATATDQTSADVDRELDALAAAGRVRLNEVGVVGALGLSIEPTRHELLVADARRFTWCALDALGILAALQATGSLRSTDPLSGQPLTVDFRTGEPTSGDLTGGIFLASLTPGTKVVDNWCPLVNLFENETNARLWAEQRGVTGEFVPVVKVTAEAGESWRARIGSPPGS